MADVSPHMRDSQRLLDHPTGATSRGGWHGPGSRVHHLASGRGSVPLRRALPCVLRAVGAHPSSHGRDGSWADRGSRVRPASLRTARDSHRGVHGASRIAWWHHHVTVRRLLIGLRPVPTALHVQLVVFSRSPFLGTIEGVSLFSRRGQHFRPTARRACLVVNGYARRIRGPGGTSGEVFDRVDWMKHLCFCARIVLSVG